MFEEFEGRGLHGCFDVSDALHCLGLQVENLGFRTSGLGFQVLQGFLITT